MEVRKQVLVSKSKYEELEAEYALLEMLFFKLSEEYSELYEAAEKAKAKKRHPSTTKKTVAKKTTAKKAVKK